MRSTQTKYGARAHLHCPKNGLGAEMFAEACERMRAGIRMQFPQAGAEEVKKELLRRLSRVRQFHEHGIYQRAPKP